MPSGNVSLHESQQLFLPVTMQPGSPPLLTSNVMDCTDEGTPPAWQAATLSYTIAFALGSNVERSAAGALNVPAAQGAVWVPHPSHTEPIGQFTHESWVFELTAAACGVVNPI